MIFQFYFNQNKTENKFHHKYHAVHISSKIADWKKYICCLCCMKNLLSEKIAMFPDILPVKVTEVLKRFTFNKNVKRVIIIATRSNSFTLESNNSFLH